MAVITGKITSIKVGSFLVDAPNAFDIGNITIVDNAPPHQSWLFYLWNLKDTDPALKRVLASQRLALVREAAFRKLDVQVSHQNDSSILDTIQVNIP